MTQKERSIEQATRMFVAQGIKSVRMDDIAQQTGVSKRTLYELFGDKEGLLFLSMSNYFEQNRCHWSQLGGVRTTYWNGCSSYSTTYWNIRRRRRG